MYRYIHSHVHLLTSTSLVNNWHKLEKYVKFWLIHLLSVSMKSFSKGWLFSTVASVEKGWDSPSSCPFLPLGLTTSSCMVCNSAVRVSAHSSSSLGVPVVDAGFFFFFTFFLGVPLPLVSLDIRLALLPVTSFGKEWKYQFNPIVHVIHIVWMKDNWIEYMHMKMRILD